MAAVSIMTAGGVLGHIVSLVLKGLRYVKVFKRT